MAVELVFLGPGTSACGGGVRVVVGNGIMVSRVTSSRLGGTSNSADLERYLQRTMCISLACSMLMSKLANKVVNSFGSNLPSGAQKNEIKHLNPIVIAMNIHG